MLGKEKDNVDKLKRRAAVVRVIMRKLFTGLKRIHSLGLVHRDVSSLGKPCYGLIFLEPDLTGPHLSESSPLLNAKEDVHHSDTRKCSLGFTHVITLTSDMTFPFPSLVGKDCTRARFSKDVQI